MLPYLGAHVQLRGDQGARHGKALPASRIPTVAVDILEIAAALQHFIGNVVYVTVKDFLRYYRHGRGQALVHKAVRLMFDQ